jgi:hypothetical protein
MKKAESKQQGAEDLEALLSGGQPKPVREEACELSSE